MTGSQKTIRDLLANFSHFIDESQIVMCSRSVIQLSGAELVVKFSLFRPHFFLLISFKIFIPLAMPSFEIVSCLCTWYTYFSLFKDYVLTFIWDPQVNTHGTFMLITRHAQGGETFEPLVHKHKNPNAAEGGNAAFLFQLCTENKCSFWGLLRFEPCLSTFCPFCW